MWLREISARLEARICSKGTGGIFMQGTRHSQEKDQGWLHL